MRYSCLAAALVIGAAAIGLVTFSIAQASVAPPIAELVQACRAEAVRGHLRHLGTQRLAIDAHKTRMIDLCNRLQVAGAADRDSLLRDCMSEAAWGALHVHRGGNHDRSHMIRQRLLCENLAAAQ